MVTRSVRSIGAVVLSMVAVMSLGLAMSVDGSTAAPKKKPFTIGYVPPTIAPFETAWRKGLQLQAKKYGMKVAIAGGQFDPKVQIVAVKTLLTRGIDALVISPLDQKSIQPTLNEVRKRKIPLVVYDAPQLKSDINIHANDAQVTAQMAQYIARKLGKSCKVAIIEGVEVVPILKARNTGYATGAQAAGCTILDKQVNTNDSAEKAADITRTWKTRFGKDLGGVLAQSDPTALAAASQLTGDFKPLIAGINGDANVIEAIRQGRIAVTASLQAPEMGNAFAYAAWRLLNGKRVPKQVLAPYRLVTAENVRSYKSYAQRLRGPMTVSFAKGMLNTKLAR